MRRPNYTGQDLPITHNTYHGGKLVHQEEGVMDLQPTWGACWTPRDAEAA